jgi:uncharacterized protein (DUF2267 family)
MGMTGLRSLDQSVMTTKEWLKDVMWEAHLDDEEDAYVITRAVLQVLRDRFRIDDAVEFGAQLPMILRGVYYDGWDPSGKPEKIRSQQEFLNRVEEHIGPRQIDARRATTAVLRVLDKHMTAGEINDVKSTLPHEILELWETEEY